MVEMSDQQFNTQMNPPINFPQNEQTMNSQFLPQGMQQPMQLPGYNAIYQGFYQNPYTYPQTIQPVHQTFGVQGQPVPDMHTQQQSSYQQPMPDLGNSSRIQTHNDGKHPENQYAYIPQRTRIAVYDDMLASPRIVDIEPNETKTYIAELATSTYNLAREEGGSIPYTVILELVENFIHAHFNESVVSILDGGNTIRFSDQGPGIEKKSQAQQPGFSSATSEMKEFIRGVGSGFPIVKSYLSVQNGKLLVEDNINQGTVITISLNPASTLKTSYEDDERPAQTEDGLNERERSILQLAKQHGSIRLVDVVNNLGYPNSSVHNMMLKLVDQGYLEGVPAAHSKIKGLTKKGEEYLGTL